MRCHSPNRLASAFTRFERLLALRDRLSAMFRQCCPDRRNTKLALEPMEERLVPDGRPLPFPAIYAGAGAGHDPIVRAYDAETGDLKFTINAYTSTFQGGVRVGTADFTGDGIPDVVTAPGLGSVPAIKVFDGTTGDQISGPLGGFLAYGISVNGGVYVAAADVDGDFKPDIITSAENALGPRVKVFSGVDGEMIADFYVSGMASTYGLTVAAADLTGDGKAEVVVGSSAGGDGWVKTFDPLTGSVISGPMGSFRAFGTSYGSGVYVGADALAGDVDDDGTVDLAVGTRGPVQSRVRVFSGATGELLHDILPFGSGVTGGARVALAYVNDDPYADVVVGIGPGNVAEVRVFDGVTSAQLEDPIGQYSPFGTETVGVFVAASNDPFNIGSFHVNYTGPTPLVEGQTTTWITNLPKDPNGPTPTGTVTFYDAVSGAALGAAAVQAMPSGDGIAGIVARNLKLSGSSMGVIASYSGDSLYNGVESSTAAYVTVNTGLDQGSWCGPGSLIGEGAGETPDAPATGRGVDSAGMLRLPREHLIGKTGLGAGSQNWSWGNDQSTADDMGGLGSSSGLDISIYSNNANGGTVNGSSLALIDGGKAVAFFDWYDDNFVNPDTGIFHTRSGKQYSISEDGTNHLIVVMAGNGYSFTFWDFSSGNVSSGLSGRLKFVTGPSGSKTEVVSWNGAGAPTEVQTVVGSGGSAITESFLTVYDGSSRTDTVTLRSKVGTGSWSTVRSVDYDYYSGSSGPGAAGQLKTATIKDASGNAIDTEYYRYYAAGSGSGSGSGSGGGGAPGLLKYSFGPKAYNRLTAALGTSLDSLTDSQVDDYADLYLEYDGSNRVTKLVAAGDGCSVCSGGQGEYTYAYTDRFGTVTATTNTWVRKVVETQPDGSTMTSYSNADNQLMLTDFDDVGSSGNWLNYCRYDATGRMILEAGPSVVTGYSESNADLVGFSGGNATHLDDDDGLVVAYTYGSSTTATTSTPGDSAGYLKQIDIKHGETGTAIPQFATSYIKRTAGSQDFFHVASNTVYRNDNGTGGQTTSYSYTWQGSTAQAESITTTLPTVTTAQNGSNSATSTTTFFDAFDRPVWSKDQAGSISYIQYDTATGAVVRMITDVDTDNSGDFANLPSGWSSPSGLHLITNYEVDSLGRVTKSTSPEGRIDYTIYDDIVSDSDPHEVRTYSGWNSTTNTPTGPTTVSRYDPAGGYTETLTMSATPNVTSNRPTGTESIAKAQSLSRSYTNAVGQMTHSDMYFDLSGLTYTTSTNFGTEGTNFYRTEYRYDNTGQLNRTETHLGTITRIVHDGQGRAVSEWIGTDDTPTSGVWSPTNLTGTNTVKVREYEYDSGGVGDGNVTKVTDYPGGGAAARVTQTWYDWRNRGVATKQGVEGSESTSVNRPLAYFDLDNLGQVTKTRVYDADTVTPTMTNDVPQPLSASLLRAQTTASFDELGRAYRTETYSVDPSNGNVGSNTLKSDTWFNARGQVIKIKSPGGLVQKFTYDGAGRTTATYISDGGGDSGYSDADDVTGDTVIEQSETSYEKDGLVLSTINRMRFHNASGTGVLGSPTSGIGARVSYAGYYYDVSSGRLTAMVDVGTNGGTAWTRPGSVPSRSDTVLVTSYNYAADAVQTVKLTGSPTGGTFTLTFGGQTTSGIAYNASAATVDSALEALSSIGSGNVVVTAAAGGGWQVRFAGTLAGKYQSKLTGSGAGLAGGTSPSVAISTISTGGDTGRVFETTDPKDLKSRSYADNLGRTIQSIENFVDGAVSDGDDKTTAFTYNSAGITSLTALLTGGGFQTTEWVFGVTQAGGSKLDSNDVVGRTKWPDPSTGTPSASEQEATTVSALGQTLTATDRNGNVHTLTYDVLERIVTDAVTTLGSGVDGAVRRIETAYDGQGNPYLITSYNASSGGSIVNQVQRAFNGLGQIVTEWQAHGGAVNTGTSPKVQYAYSEMASGANHSRLTSMTYPSGYVLTSNYSSGLNSDISRLSSLSDSSGTVESHDYLGLGTVVRRGHSQPGVDLTFIKQSGGSNGDAGDQYTGLDRFGRVVDQRWIKTSSGTATDRFRFGYDRNSNRLWRDNLVNTAFGELYAYDSLNQLTSFDRGTLNGTKTGLTGSASRAQDWDYDAMGNWDSLTTDSSTQTRTANAQNEITSVSGATTPTYDANGNMTRAETGLRYVYDAWNRLVAVKDSPGTTTLKTYSYDGLNRRGTETTSGTMTDLYYSDQWQVLEEKIGANTSKRYIWSPVYVDSMILRDRDSDTNGSLDERLWVQQDANWNITSVLDGNGAVVERYAFDTFGARTVFDSNYSLRGGGSSFAFGHGFQGLWFDVTAGLNEADHRWHSPTLGRWVSLDPINYLGGDVNLYSFVSNNPSNRVDPLGLARYPIGTQTSGGFGPSHPPATPRPDFSFILQFQLLGLVGIFQRPNIQVAINILNQMTCPLYPAERAFLQNIVNGTFSANISGIGGFALIAAAASRLKECDRLTFWDSPPSLMGDYNVFKMKGGCTSGAPQVPKNCATVLQQLQPLLNQLTNPDYQIREAASRAILMMIQNSMLARDLTWFRCIRAELASIANNSPDPEARARALDLLDKYRRFARYG